MASDISKCISSNSVRHGSSLVLAPDKTALTNNIITDHSLTNPSVSSIETRYDARFDDPTYYGGGGLLLGLVASYRLDEESGVRYDRSNNGRHLTDNNTVGSVSGKVGVAADFTESNSEYLSLANASLGGISPGSTDFTISFWIYFKNSGFTGQQFVGGIWKTSGSEREWLFLLDGSQELGFYTSANGSSETSIKSGELSDSTWYHIVVTHDNTGGARKLYVNNSAVSNDSNVTINQGDGDFQLGNTQNSSDYLNGYLDEFNMWNKVLTTDNIANLYNSGNGKHVR
jgi:hypothetical protein